MPQWAENTTSPTTSPRSPTKTLSPQSTLVSTTGTTSSSSSSAVTAVTSGNETYTSFDCNTDTSSSPRSLLTAVSERSGKAKGKSKIGASGGGGVSRGGGIQGNGGLTASDSLLDLMASDMTVEPSHSNTQSTRIGRSATTEGIGRSKTSSTRDHGSSLAKERGDMATSSSLQDSSPTFTGASTIIAGGGATPSPKGIGSRTNHATSTTTLGGGVDLKVVILGAQGVGKTSLVHRYTSGQFSASSVPSTIGASFLTKKLIVDEVKVRLQLWDTAGQERFRSMAPMYYRGSNAAVIVYDITNPASFDDVRIWIEELRKNVHTDLVIHIVGSKLDLAPHSRHVRLDDAQRLVATWTRSLTATQQQQHSTPSSGPGLSRSQSSRGATNLNGGSSLKKPSSSPSSPPGSSASRLGGFGSLTGMSVKRNQQQDDGDLDGGAAGSSSNPSSTGSSDEFISPGAERAAWDFIEITEVSAKDNEGIEDVFVGIATRLVERKEEIEAQRRKLRSDRESIFVSEHDSLDTASRFGNGTTGADGEYQGSSWCCNI